MEEGNQGKESSCLMCGKKETGLVMGAIFQEETSKVRGAMEKIFEGLGIPRDDVCLVVFLLEKPQTLCASCHSAMQTLLALQGEVTALEGVMRKYAVEGIGNAILKTLGGSEEDRPSTPSSGEIKKVIMWKKFQLPVLQNFSSGRIKLSVNEAESDEDGMPDEEESVSSSHSPPKVKEEELEEGELREIANQLLKKTSAEKPPNVQESRPASLPTSRPASATEPESSSSTGGSGGTTQTTGTAIAEERDLRDTLDHERRRKRRTHPRRRSNDVEDSDMSKRRRDTSASPPSSADTDRRGSPGRGKSPCRYTSVPGTSNSNSSRRCSEWRKEWRCQRNCPLNITDNGDELRRSVVDLRGQTVKTLGFVPEREEEVRGRGERRRDGGRCVVRGCNAEGEWLDVPGLLHHIHGRIHSKGLRNPQNCYLVNM